MTRENQTYLKKYFHLLKMKSDKDFFRSLWNHHLSQIAPCSNAFSCYANDQSFEWPCPTKRYYINTFLPIFCNLPNRDHLHTYYFYLKFVNILLKQRIQLTFTKSIMNFYYFTVLSLYARSILFILSGSVNGILVLLILVIQGC